MTKIGISKLERDRQDISDVLQEIKKKRLVLTTL